MSIRLLTSIVLLGLIITGCGLVINSHGPSQRRVTFKVFSSRPSYEIQQQTSITPTTTINHETKPVTSLRNRNWVKLICGASNQDAPLIRNLCYIYTLANVDCIDICADKAIAIAARDGINAAILSRCKQLVGIISNTTNSNAGSLSPYLMISVNDDDDPHFRKAFFNPEECPIDCTRPCEKVCPALAIPPLSATSILLTSHAHGAGVIDEKCYGCGRCFSVCPYDLIQSKSYTVQHEDINQLFQSKLVDAIEIHTQHGHVEQFRQLWQDIGETVLSSAKAIAVSFPDMGGSALTAAYLDTLQEIMTYDTNQDEEQRPWSSRYHGVQIWQADGKPMTGDIGRGATHATCELATRMLDHYTRPTSSELKLEYPMEAMKKIQFGQSSRHFIQLAGGTNDYSATVAAAVGLTSREGFGGYGFGGYARKTIVRKLLGMEENSPGAKIEDFPDLFHDCLVFARNLVDSAKGEN